MEMQEHVTHDWKIVGASVTGTNHESNHTGCEDFHDFRKLEDGSILIAVADGAGSASHALEGAKYVVKKSLDIMAKAITECVELGDEQQCQDWLTDVLREVRGTLEEKVMNEVSRNINNREKSSQFILPSTIIKDDTEESK